jgi:non-canonical (house-cleaning) NTP pyrophosphatase
MYTGYSSSGVSGLHIFDIYVVTDYSGNTRIVISVSFTYPSLIATHIV